jgi:hypothetical protein
VTDVTLFRVRPPAEPNAALEILIEIVNAFRSAVGRDVLTDFLPARQPAS